MLRMFSRDDELAISRPYPASRTGRLLRACGSLSTMRQAEAGSIPSIGLRVHLSGRTLCRLRLAARGPSRLTSPRRTSCSGSGSCSCSASQPRKNERIASQRSGSGRSRVVLGRGLGLRSGPGPGPEADWRDDAQRVCGCSGASYLARPVNQSRVESIGVRTYVLSSQDDGRLCLAVLCCAVRHAAPRGTTPRHVTSEPYPEPLAAVGWS